MRRPDRRFFWLNSTIIALVFSGSATRLVCASNRPNSMARCKYDARKGDAAAELRRPYTMHWANAWRCSSLSRSIFLLNSEFLGFVSSNRRPLRICLVLQTANRAWPTSFESKTTNSTTDAGTVRSDIKSLAADVNWRISAEPWTSSAERARDNFAARQVAKVEAASMIRTIIGTILVPKIRR